MKVEVPGGEGEVVSLRGEVLALRLSRPFAPGSPVDLRIEADDAAIVRVRGKTVSSRRREDERYDVRLRIVTLRKDDRRRLARFESGDD